MKSERWLSLVFGLALVALGGFTLLGNTVLATGAWRLWPLVVVLAGIAMTVPGFFGFKRRGFGGFFIPGIPLMTTGGILLVASLLGWWEVWALLWPLEVIALALGFALAAIFMRSAGLVIPAVLIGLNGLVLAFCNLTGLWSAWALAWPVEPLAVGLGLLMLAYTRRYTGVRTAGLILIGIAGAGFFLMSFLSTLNHTILRFAVPVMLILCGLVLLAAHWSRLEGQVAPDNHLAAEETA